MISNYSDKINPLLSVTTFPLANYQIESFKSVIEDICSAALAPVDPSLTFVVETDVAVAATLTHSG